jgi:hypothetical protein
VAARSLSAAVRAAASAMARAAVCVHGEMRVFHFLLDLLEVRCAPLTLRVHGEFANLSQHGVVLLCAWHRTNAVRFA